MLTRFVNKQSAGGDGTTNATSGATAAFATLDAAAEALAGDYTAEVTETVVVHGRNFNNIAVRIICDMGSPRAVDTQQALFSGNDWTLDTTHRLLIQAADGTTMAGQATNNSRPNFSNGNGFGTGYEVQGSANFQGSIRIDTEYTYVIDLQATRTSGSGRMAWQFGTGQELYGINCLGDAISGSGSFTFSPGRFTKLINCLGRSPDDDNVFDANQASTEGVRYYNCGAIILGTGPNGFVTGGTAAGVAKNCWAFGSATADYDANFTAASSNNASEDLTAPGANPQTGLVSTAGVDFEDFGNSDYRPATGGKLDGTGEDLSADSDFAFAFDITGAARTQWEIGPFALSGAGGVSPIPIFNHYYRHLLAGGY